MNPFNESLKRARAAARLACICAVIVVFSGGSFQAGTTNPITLPFYNTAEFTPEWIEPGGPEFAGIHRIADFCVTNQVGAAITSADFAGHIYAANFFFTACPGICLSMTQNLKRVQDAFAEDSGVLLISHSVTPEFDSPTVLKRYGDAHGVVAGKWHLVTGSREGLYGLARNSYFAEVKTGTEESEFIHSENVLLVDGKRRIRGVYNGTLALDMNRLIEDIRCLQREKN